MIPGGIMALIISLALEIGVDANLALSIIEQENPMHESLAVHQNVNGSQDLGIMQLNSRSIPIFLKLYWDKGHDFDWKDPVDNIYLGLKHLKDLLSTPGMNEWQAIICYNAGTAWYRNGTYPPASSIDYANAVYMRWRGRKNDPGLRRGLFDE